MTYSSDFSWTASEETSGFRTRNPVCSLEYLSLREQASTYGEEHMPLDIDSHTKIFMANRCMHFSTCVNFSDWIPGTELTQGWMNSWLKNLWWFVIFSLKFWTKAWNINKSIEYFLISNSPNQEFNSINQKSNSILCRYLDCYF